MDEIHINLHTINDFKDIVINKELLLHISSNSGSGYDIDIYAYNSNKSDNDIDWDDEYITSNYVSYDSINNRIGINKWHTGTK